MCWMPSSTVGMISATAQRLLYGVEVLLDDLFFGKIQKVRPLDAPAVDLGMAKVKQVREVGALPAYIPRFGVVCRGVGGRL
nr:MAG TPA: hypothetical protein [Caudoviricetes sp.]